jgi:hypothetical protein
LEAAKDTENNAYTEGDCSGVKGRPHISVHNPVHPIKRIEN